MPDEGEQGGIGETFTGLAKTYAPTFPLFFFFFHSTQFKVVGYFFLPFARSAIKILFFPRESGKCAREREREGWNEWTDEKLLRDSRSETRAAREGEEKSFLPGWRKG